LAETCGVSGSELILRTGDPAECIAGLAAEPAADLVVLGSIKRSRLEAALLGSTAERVVDEGRCDVLLVRAPS
ncbi:MAG: universal stress protein, partial [Gammaproteobacteria bacterium]